MRVLDADCDLAEGLDDQQLHEARCALVAPAIRLAKGDWNPSHAARTETAQLGVLVTKGILCREVAIGGNVYAELVGTGDLLWPWEGPHGSSLLACHVRWRVLEEAQIAMLGRRFANAAAQWPALTSALVSRAIRRSNSLALSATISCTTGLEDRLLMLFWHLAHRWGKVRRDGMLVPIQMTHELIGRLISARRPSVSTALKKLECDGLVIRLSGGEWLLSGDSPHAALRHDATRCDNGTRAGLAARQRAGDQASGALRRSAA